MTVNYKEDGGKKPKDGSVSKQVAVGVVTKKHPSGIIDEKQEKVGDTLTYPDPARVGMSLSFTKNLGNFESTRVEVRLDMPCEPTVEAIEGAYSFAEGWVNKKMEENIEDLGGA